MLIRENRSHFTDPILEVLRPVIAPLRFRASLI